MTKSYMICGTPRTGSTLLCGLLKAAGAGDPHSFYRREDIAEWAEGWGLPSGPQEEPQFRRAYLDAVLRAGRGGTPIFGMRLMQENLGELSAILDSLHPGLPDDRARLEHAFGRLTYLHLSRRDKLAQAVSLVKARQTGLWHVAPDGAEIERVAPPRDPRYDFAAIRREVVEMEAHDAAWEGWFRAHGIVPLRIGYETLAAEPARTLTQICAALGIAPPGEADMRPGVARLADATSLDWARRYREDLQPA